MTESGGGKGSWLEARFTIPAPGRVGRMPNGAAAGKAWGSWGEVCITLSPDLWRRGAVPGFGIQDGDGPRELAGLEPVERRPAVLVDQGLDATQVGDRL